MLTTTTEAEALAYARAWVARMKEGDFIDGLAPLDPKTGPAFFRKILKLSDATTMLTVVDLAYAGIEHARLALNELVNEYLNRGEALPSFLADYTARTMSNRTPPPRLRGKSKLVNYLADIATTVLISELIQRFDLHPTRGQLAKRRHSACSIVALGAIGKPCPQIG